MASVNLASLSTFWQSIKTYLYSKFSDRTRLYNGTGATSITLSESVDNFEYLEIYVYAATSPFDVPREMVRMTKVSSAGINFRIPFFKNTADYNILGIATFGINTNGVSVSLVANQSIGRRFATNNYYTHSSVTFYIRRVYGIKRKSS